MYLLKIVQKGVLFLKYTPFFVAGSIPISIYIDKNDIYMIINYNITDFDDFLIMIILGVQK